MKEILIETVLRETRFFGVSFLSIATDYLGGKSYFSVDNTFLRNASLLLISS